MESVATLNTKNRKKNSSAESIDAVVRSNSSPVRYLRLRSHRFHSVQATMSIIEGRNRENSEILDFEHAL